MWKNGELLLLLLLTLPCLADVTRAKKSLIVRLKIQSARHTSASHGVEVSGTCAKI